MWFENLTPTNAWCYDVDITESALVLS